MELDKVITAMNICTNLDNPDKEVYCYDCPYKRRENCSGDLMRDLAALVRGQSPIRPTQEQNTIKWLCGDCGALLMGEANYCPRCGRAVQWV